jgi:type IV secretion system protein VirB10
MVTCTLTNNVYSDNGNVLLFEKGSTVVGEYQSGLAQGQNRLFLLWNRIKTPEGVVADLSSPASGSLGAAGVGGHIDTHFWERFGGAIMLSLIDDAAAFASNQSSNDDNTIKFDNTSDASQEMAAEVLRNTINIPATLKKNQGERVGIFVARDVDFSNVYSLSLEKG